MGIVFIFFGIVVALATLPLIRGEAQARTYNYRPWQPKFVRELTDEEANDIGRRTAKYGIYLGVLMALTGVASIILGATGLGDYILWLINLSVIIALLMITAVYAYTYKESKKKHPQ